MLETDDPSAVIRGLRNGSRDAWTVLYDRYCEDVWRYVARLLGPNAAAVADVVQETFLAAARSARGFDSERGSLGGWLTGIAHHRVTHHWRQAGRVERLRKLAESGAAEIRNHFNNQASSRNAANTLELADLVRGTLAEISAEYAALLTAKCILMQTFDIAHRNQIPGVEEPVRKFAFEQLPEILKRQQSTYGNTATAPLAAVKEVLGPNAALRFIVERMEQWPQHLQVTNENSWRSFGNSLAEVREVAGMFDESHQYSDLEPRVIKLVVAELKQYLFTGESGDQSIYFRNNVNYWSEKADVFARAADEVRAEHKTSGRRVKFVAEYFWNGLERRGRAIELMLIANAAGVLDDDGQQQLGLYLQQEQRYGESIPVFEPLVIWKPENMYWRTLLMRAYHESHRPEQLNELVSQTDKYFHAGGRWTMQNIAALAEACLDCKLYKRSIGYCNEAIAIRRRTNVGSELGDAWLSEWYQSLASAQSALGHTPEAVDAASAAIVCWSPRQRQRAGAIQRLKTVLSNAKDIDAFVQHLDDDAKKTGQDSPLLRKTIGEVYQERHDYMRAIAQFDFARQLQPNNKETYQALIDCYDALHEPQKATRQLLALVDFDRHDLKLYEQLAERLNGDGPEAERAATSIIEAGPSEAENHQALAELREKQDRWNEAIDQWKEVAELRRLEPTGLLKLAAAEIHQKQWTPARETLDKLNKTEWPGRFNTVGNEVQRLRSLLPK